MPLSIWEKTDAALKSKHIPINVILELTRRCNLRCLHCYNIKDDAHLSFDQVQIIFQQLREAGCLFLTLTGGEFFTRQDACAILRSAREHGFDLKIITNGTLITAEVIQCLQEVAPSEIGISLQGADAQTHDRISGVDGSFDSALQAVKDLKAARIPVHIKCTLMKENIHQAQAVMDLAKALGVVYIIDPIISPKDDGSRDCLEHRLDQGQMEQFYCGQLKGMEREETSYQGFPCDAGQTFGAISSTGDVYPCIQLPVKVGNVFEQDLKDIWQNDLTLIKIREASSDDFGKCGECSLAHHCTRCPGLAYLEEGDMFGPSSVACFIAELAQREKL